MGEKVVRLAVSLFIGVWVARYLGADQYGIYSYALSFSILFGALASFGIDGIIVRDLVKHEEKTDFLLGTAFCLKFLGGLLSFFIAVVVLFFIETDTYIKSLIFILVGSTIVKSFNVIDFYFQSKVLSKYVVTANTYSLFLSSLIKVALILMEAPLIAFVLVLLFDSITVSLGFLYYYKREKLSIWKWKVDVSLAKDLLKESWPLILSGLAISVGMRIDQIMLKEFVPANQLGFYAVGVRLAELFSFIPMVITQSIFPKIVSIDFSSEKRKLGNLIRYIFYPLCLMALFVCLVGEFTVNLLYGQEFASSSSVLLILIWTIPVTYLGIITNKLIMVQGHQKIIFMKQLVLTLMNIGLNLYLIPRYGIVGAAWATLLADIFVNLFIDVVFNKARWIYFLKMKALFFINLAK